MPSPARGRFDVPALACGAVLALSFLAYLWIFLPLVPADGHSMGDDYSLWFPNLLAGYYWFVHNGSLTTPWFSPAQCGGVPFFADANTGYFSFPQWATFAAGPITAVRATFVLFAALGAAGFHLLLRARFGVGAAAAATAAVLFLFNSFYAYRMAIGHLSFHPFALTPWLAWAVLAPRPPRTERIEWVCSIAWPPLAGGLIVAYMLQAGMVHAILPICIAVAVILLVHGQMHGHRLRPWILLASAGAVSCALSASRLGAILAFQENFPRTMYPLPGYSDPLLLAGIAAATLFWRVPPVEANERLENKEWTLNNHEWEYGVGPAALVLLAAGAAVAAARMRKAPPSPGRIVRCIPVCAAIAAALALPLVLNWYEPGWNRVLKSLPYFGSSSNLVRWFALYIPVVALLAGLALQRIAPGARRGLAVAVLAAIVTIAWNAALDKSYYTSQSYDGARLDAAWLAARSSGRVPPVTHVVELRDESSGKLVLSEGRNDTLALGYSHLHCYQPLFGYRMESFPVGPLRPGPALEETAEGLLNVKNPACYLFPRENGCEPGSHFGTHERHDAIRFLNYEPFEFALPPRQIGLNALTRGTLLAAALLIFGTACFALRRAFAR